MKDEIGPELAAQFVHRHVVCGAVMGHAKDVLELVTVRDPAEFWIRNLELWT